MGGAGITHLWTLAVEEQFYLVWSVLAEPAGHRGAVRSPAPGADRFGARHRHRDERVDADDGPGHHAHLNGAQLLGDRDGHRRRRQRGLGWPRLARLLPASRIQRAALSLLSLAILSVIALSPLAKNWHITYLAIGPLVALLTVVLFFHLREWKTFPARWLRPALALGTIS